MLPFNALLLDFIRELSATFPEERGLSFSSSMLSTVDPALPASMFRETFGPYADLIAARDPALFAKPDLDMGGFLDLGKMWADPSLSEDSRTVIWQYIQALMVLCCV